MPCISCSQQLTRWARQPLGTKELFHTVQAHLGVDTSNRWMTGHKVPTKAYRHCPMGAVGVEPFAQVSVSVEIRLMK